MIIFLSGSTSGIGKAILQHFVDKGDTLIICSRKAVEYKNKKYKNNSKVYAYNVNFFDIQSIRFLMHKVKKNFKKIDVIINNAGGVKKNTTFLTANYEDYLNNFNLNFFSHVLIIKHLYKLMSKSKIKQIINISSITGKRPGYLNPGYSAAKASLNNFTKYLANFFANKNILVNTISPGVIDTDGFKRNLTKLSIEKNVNFKTILRIEKNKIPLKRLGQPSDILNLVKFLVYKNTWMTGSNIVIDGGKIETLG
jgi:NAD(P)-dependent dehydrogenase (short-subunit alcohol dehydrogenase family)